MTSKRMKRETRKMCVVTAGTTILGGSTSISKGTLTSP